MVAFQQAQKKGVLNRNAYINGVPTLALARCNTRSFLSSPRCRRSSRRCAVPPPRPLVVVWSGGSRSGEWVLGRDGACGASTQGNEATASVAQPPSSASMAAPSLRHATTARPRQRRLGRRRHEPMSRWRRRRRRLECHEGQILRQAFILFVLLILKSHSLPAF